MKKKVIFFLLLAFFLGLVAAFFKKPSPSVKLTKPFRIEEILPVQPGLEVEGTPLLPEEDQRNDGLPDLTGMSVGQAGSVVAEVPPPGMTLKTLGRELSSPASGDDDILDWPKTSGKLKEIEEQVREIRSQVDEVTLDAVSKALNALPFVSAEPEEAEWHVSGGEIGLEITIPVEDIRIGTGSDQ